MIFPVLQGGLDTLIPLIPKEILVYFIIYLIWEFWNLKLLFLESSSMICLHVCTYLPYACGLFSFRTIAHSFEQTWHHLGFCTVTIIANGAAGSSKSLGTTTALLSPNWSCAKCSISEASIASQSFG